MLDLTAPHIHRLNAYWYRTQRVDQSVVARAGRLVEKALEGGNYHTREEVQELLARSGITAEKIRLAALMMHLELDGLIVSGPMRGKRHTYALLDERAPAVAPVARDEALARLAHRFFTGHGPATVRHFAWWSKLSLRDCVAGLAAARSRLTSDTIGGIEWFGFADPVPRSPVRGALFIPEFDEALVGSKEFGLADLPHARRKWTDTFLSPGTRGRSSRRHLAPAHGPEGAARDEPLRAARRGAGREARARREALRNFSRPACDARHVALTAAGGDPYVEFLPG